MKIEGNQKELDAMVEFHKGNRVEGLRLQEEFAAEFRKEYKDKDHCPCLKACRYHGNCKECVAIHRAHQEHVPNCMRPLINKKLKLMSELTEHTLANEIEAPCHERQLPGPTGILPRVGFKPIKPQKLAGIRMDPPPSLAVAIGKIPLATNAAAPPLDPPANRVVSKGFKQFP